LKQSLFKAELSTILKNKKILIPMIAIMLVPVLYAGMFLWAFWDPYAKLDHLPVAIVNQDAGAKLDGKKLNLGDDLVKKLEKSKDFGFETVDKKAGYRNLKNQKYYMLIEIPKDFSKNATTLLDNQPKKLELVYVPNEGYNFLSAQIGGSAVEKIKSAVSEKVTQTYAETMFDKVTELADGIQKASDGAGQLNDGSTELNQGTQELQQGLATLAEKSIQFHNGMKTAHSGSDKLASGSTELYTGLAQLAEKSIEFNNGIKTADSGATKLAAGSTDIKNGLAEVDSKMPELINGTQAATDEIKTKLPAGIAAEIEKQLTGSVGQLNTGVDQFKTTLGTTLTKQIAEKVAKETIATQTAKMQELAKTLLNNGVPQETVQQIMVHEQQNAPTQDQLQAQLEQQLAAELSPGLDQGFNQFKTALGSQLLGATSGLESSIKSKTDPVFDQLAQGINNGQIQLQQGIHQLYAGSLALNSGANELSSGMTQLSDGAGQMTAGAGQLSAGSNALKNGAADLSSGMNQLTAGADALTSGAGQLADGSNQLKDGTSKLNEGAQELANKLSDGANEAAKVHANDDTYNMMADPVKLDKEEVNKVPNYGTGFAPYFLSLGLFVGALLLSIVFPIRDAVVKPANGFSLFASKFGIMAGVGVIQALIADGILLYGLELQVQSVPRFILFSILTSLTFIALIQLLVSVLADVGRFIAILILIFQLTTSAGTFPLELIPNFLQHFNAFLPMTYSVQGFKAVISSGDYSYMWHNGMILVSYILSFAVLTTGYFSLKHNHQYKHQLSE
jgi:putative membrane protein